MKIQPLLLVATVTLLPLLSAKAAAPTSCCAVAATTCPAMTPAKFADTVATVDTLEIKLGQVAQTNASLPSVKKFGLMMVEGHTALRASLAKVAAEEKIALPTKLDPKHQDILKKLSALKGPAFDKTYVPAMVEGHTKVLAMFKAYAKDGTNPGLQKFAKKNTSVIANHLKMAQKVQAEMQKAGQL